MPNELKYVSMWNLFPAILDNTMSKGLSGIGFMISLIPKKGLVFQETNRTLKNSDVLRK